MRRFRHVAVEIPPAWRETRTGESSFGRHPHVFSAKRGSKRRSRMPALNDTGWKPMLHWFPERPAMTRGYPKAIPVYPSRPATAHRLPACIHSNRWRRFPNTPTRLRHGINCAEFRFRGTCHHAIPHRDWSAVCRLLLRRSLAVPYRLSRSDC